MPTRIEQAFIVSLAATVFVLVVGSVLCQYGRQSGMCDVADPSARRTISFSVDINAATSPELSLLPTVGPVMAQRIVDFRETNGPFSSDADLLSVKGIGPKKFAAMAPYLIIAKPEARPRPATVNGSHSQTVDNTWRADHNRRDSDDAQP